MKKPCKKCLPLFKAQLKRFKAIQKLSAKVYTVHARWDKAMFAKKAGK